MKSKKDYLQKSENSLLLKIKVYPNAKQNKTGHKIADENGDLRLKIFVNAKPEDGKANKAVIEFLSKSLKLTKSDIEILNGHTNKLKTIKINANGEESLSRIIEYFEPQQLF
jgi:uncharacterized protein (TIGR00251 family)